MAISATHYQILRELQPLLTRGGSLLEIGEANWYGDQNPACLLEVVDEATAEVVREAIASRNWFSVAKACYAALFTPRRVVSIDLNGTPQALRYDLNKPLPPLGQFDVVINHGTAEHVFNIGQVFASMHAACKVGGLMMHESPFTGWIDHGFYCLQPTLFYDLAAANGYEIVGVWLEEIKSRFVHRVASRERMTELAGNGSIPDNAMLFVVYRKASAGGFRLPAQGYYAQTLSKAGKQAWEVLR